MGCAGVMVITSDYQSRESGFESSCCRFEALAISFIPSCHAIDEYLAIDSGGYMNE